jgi:hypothetical protein
MNAASPQTPDVDLPGQPHDQADLDIEVEPEPEPERAQAEGASGEPGGEDAPGDDPEVGNTLIRPENS